MIILINNAMFYTIQYNDVTQCNTLSRRVVAATPIKATAVSLPLSQYSGMEMEDLPEDEGMDDLDLGLEEALQGTFTTQSTITADEKVDEGRVIFLLVVYISSSMSCETQ